MFGKEILTTTVLCATDNDRSTRVYMKNSAGMQTSNITISTNNTFCLLFREVVRRFPDRTAVFCSGERLVYIELNRRSDLLACYLVGRGIKREDIIGIATGRSIETIISMIGIWKAGGAYLYLNPNYPQHQLEEIKQQCSCECVIDKRMLDEIDWSVAEPVSINFSAPESLALLVFTSGSTARPKGVMIEHRNVMAMFHSMADIGYNEQDAVCLFPSLSFVASVSDIFTPLLTGAAIYIIEEEKRKDISLILQYFMDNKISVSFLPPHMAEKLNEAEQEAASLRLLLVGSDNMRNITPQRYEIRHVYGSSEMCSLVADYVIKDKCKSYPIGKIKPGILFYITGEDGRLVERGQNGELWLSGPQVSRGYHNNPTKTAEHYALNPFAHLPGYERVFKTGDIVCQLEDGNIKYVSRRDNMYKIRGFRVEANAVESVILQYPGIMGAVVKAFPDCRGYNILCGYFIAEDKKDPKKIKDYLREYLPQYMIPACIIQMNEFPRNINNKISRVDFEPPAEIDDHKLLEKLY